MFNDLDGQPPFVRRAAYGFRCARYITPPAPETTRPIVIATRNVGSEKPVGDAILRGVPESKGLYVPGSVFKIVTSSRVSDQGASNPPRRSRAGGGREDGLVVTGFRINEHAGVPTRTFDLDGATESSSNIWFALAGLQTGGQNLTDSPESASTNRSRSTCRPCARRSAAAGRSGRLQRRRRTRERLVHRPKPWSPRSRWPSSRRPSRTTELMQPRLVTAMTGKQGPRRSVRRDHAGHHPRRRRRDCRGDVPGRRGRPRPAVHAGREGAGHPDRRQVRHGGARRPGEPHSWFIGFAPATIRRSRSRSSSSAAGAVVLGRRRSRARS